MRKFPRAIIPALCVTLVACEGNLAGGQLPSGVLDAGGFDLRWAPGNDAVIDDTRLSRPRPALADGGADSTSEPSAPDATAPAPDVAQPTPDVAQPAKASCSFTSRQRSIAVADAAGLNKALAGAACGDELVLADGDYQSSKGFVLAATCAAATPVVIRAATLLGATVRSPLTLQGDHGVVCGLRFAGGGHLVVKGKGHRILRCSISGWRHPAAILALGGEGLEVGCCELSEPHPWLGAKETSSYPLRIGIRSGYKQSFHARGWVHHSHFHDFPAKPDPASYHSGQSDAIEICFTGYTKLAQWIVEDNLIERHLQGHGIIDCKCGGNTIRRNTVLASPGGRIDLRNGSYGRVEANWLEDSGGIGVRGGHHVIEGNHLERCALGIAVNAGEAAWDDPANTAAAHAYKVRVAGNAANKLVVGKSYNSKQSWPAVGTLVEGHVGPITKQLEQGTVIKAGGAAAGGAAKRLSPAAVGPRAAAVACALP